MEITTWNIQAALGVDDVVDPLRIVNHIKAFGNSEILCIQEVIRNESDDSYYGLAEELRSNFPEYEMMFGPAVNRTEEKGRYQFGNLILSKVPVDAVFMHRLPQPSDPTTRTMARQAIEIIVSYNDQPLRVVTTHLEYFGIQQREAQLRYLGEYQQECCGRFNKPSPSGEGSYVAPPETNRTIVCGDFNMESGTDHYQQFLTYGFSDAWTIAHGSHPHAPTCGIYDHKQWADGEHARDFFFVSDALTDVVADVQVDTKTQASDHQPVKLILK